MHVAGAPISSRDSGRTCMRRAPRTNRIAMALLCCGLAALLPSCSDSDGVGTLVPGTGSIELSESNIALSDWGRYLGDATLTAAILDRLAMHAVRIHIDGPSYRQHLAMTRAAEAASAAT